MLNRIKARTVSLLAMLALVLSGVVAVGATPAEAAPAGCIVDIGRHELCFYTSSTQIAESFSEGWFTDTPRNTCIVVGSFNDASYWNDTTVQWYGFNTTTCNGSHVCFCNNFAEVGIYPTGHIHAVMRTSTLI